MKFIKYPSLTNFYAISKSNLLMSYLEKEFYITEKIHGANIQISMNSNYEINLGKRSSFLSDGEKQNGQFSHLNNFYNENKEFIDEKLKLFLKSKDNIEEVILYGELYGNKIQKMEYKENLEGKTSVRFFNVILLMNDDSLIKLSHDNLVDNFPTEMIVPYLGKDKLKDLIVRDINDGKLDQSVLGGLSEGFVYQYWGELVLTKGHFVGIKHKTKAYEERNNIKPNKSRETTQLTEEEIKVLTELRSRITMARLNNVLSHGELELEPKNFGDLIKLYQKDVVDEIERETSDVKSTILNKMVNKTSKEIVDLFKEKMKQDLI